GRSTISRPRSSGAELQAQLLHGPLDHFRRQRDVAILDHHFLPLPGHHQLDELGIQRAQRLVRCLVHVHVEEARQRVLAGQRIGFVGFLDLAALGHQRHGANAGGLVADARVTDGVQGAGDRLHHGSRTRLLVDVGFEVAFAQGLFLEVAVGAGYRVTTEQLDRLARPFAAQADVPPASQVLVLTAQTGAGEDRVDLLHGQRLDRVVLVHEHGQGVDGHRNGGGLVAVFLLEGLDLTVLHRTAHWPHIGGAFGQRGWRSGGTGGLDLDVYVGVVLLELFCPQGHQVGQRVGADAGQVARYTGGLFIGRQSRVDGGYSRYGAYASGGESQGRHQTLQFHALLLADSVVSDGTGDRKS